MTDLEVGEDATREIIWDTETTGMSSNNGDRLVEIAAIETMGRIPTGKTFHRYVNPERDVSEGAFRVHGLSREFLRDHKVFAEVADDFLDFVGDSPMVAHNAPFDVGFINAELRRMGRRPLANLSIDTVKIARRSFPGASIGLDALCRRFGIDLSARTRHAALLDCELLARVYMELCGGRQRVVALGGPLVREVASAAVARAFRPARAMGLPSVAELELHAAFVGALKAPIWRLEESEVSSPRI